jgi:Cytochrome c oxidase biogenesis protein Cmc1 like
MLRGRPELDQVTEQKAVSILKSRAKKLCSVELARFAACMRLEGFLGPFRCKGRLRDLNGCLHAQYATPTYMLANTQKHNKT